MFNRKLNSEKAFAETLVLIPSLNLITCGAALYLRDYMLFS